MNQPKRWLSFATGLCLLLAGCAPAPIGGSSVSDEPLQAMGRYVEESLSLPAEEEVPLKLLVGPEGDLVYFSTPLQQQEPSLRHYRSDDGEHWEQQDTSWTEDILQSESGLSEFVQVALGEDGSVYTVVQDATSRLRLYRAAPGGDATEIDIPYWGEPPAQENGLNFTLNGGTVAVAGESAGNLPAQPADMGHSLVCSGLAVLPGGDLLVSYFSAPVDRYDGATGALKKRYDTPTSGSCSPALVNGEEFVQLDYNSQKLMGYQLESGETTQNTDASPLMTAGAYGQLLAVGEGQALYAANSGGVHRLAPGGSLWETILEGAQFSMGMPSLQLDQFVRMEDGSFYAIYSGQNGSYKLKRYRYSADTPSTPDTELTVYSLYDNYTVRQAIGEFQQKHPNVLVNLRIGLDSESAATLSDVIKSLNTELLAGRGPDILILDGLPIESYIEKGALTDLSALTARLEGQLFENILAPYQREGKSYALPARFSIPLMYGDETLLAGLGSLEQLATASETAGETPLFKVRDAGELLELLYSTASTQLLDGSGALNETALRSFLENAKRILDTQETQDTNSMMAGMAIATGSGQALSINTSVTAYGSQAAQLCMQDTLGFQSLQLPLAQAVIIYNIAAGAADANEPAQPEGPVTSVQPLIQQPVFTPSTIAGVNAGSAQQELAAAFVEELLSPGVQDYNFNDGFPVNRSSFAKGQAGLMEENETAPDLTNLVQSLQTPSLSDRVVREAVLSHGANYLQGETTLDAALDAIRSAVGLYLAES